MNELTKKYTVELTGEEVKAFEGLMYHYNVSEQDVLKVLVRDGLVDYLKKNENFADFYYKIWRTRYENN